MKYDREEAYLREKLTDGLHPADVDLWPAVAEHLPDARPARHWRRRIWPGQVIPAPHRSCSPSICG